MNKRLGILCFIVAVVALVSIGFTNPTYHKVRIAGTSGYAYAHAVDTSDTNASGVLLVNDSIYSDTITLVYMDNQFNVDSAFRYANIVIRLSDIDTGDVLDDDTTLDAWIVNTIVAYGGCQWTAYADTFSYVGDSARHHFILDTLAYTELFFFTNYIDTLNPSDDDVNTFTWEMDVLLGGVR